MIAVVGLGRVGVAVAVAFAASGARVHAVDRAPACVELLVDGRLPFDDREPDLAALLADVTRDGRLTASTSFEGIAGADAILVCVETPASSAGPAFEALRACCVEIGRGMRRGALVIVESTLAPGTMRDLVAPTLEEASGLLVDRDFLLGHCPERVMPGRLLRNLREMSRVCGGSVAATKVMVALYRAVVSGDLDETDWITAELTKTAENTHRDVSVAFANQLARACEHVGADFLEVRALVEKIGDRTILDAGAGVGGQCMTKDPWLFATACDPAAPSLVPAARAINDAMPHHVVALVEDALREAAVPVAGAVIALLGMSYKAGSAEARLTPSLVVRDELHARGAVVRAHDSLASAFTAELATVLAGADAAVLLVAHEEYRRLSLDDLARTLQARILVDARLVFTPDAARSAGLVFRGVGRGT